jgi:RNA polymerase sigma factor (sigma-70 family)
MTDIWNQRNSPLQQVRRRQRVEMVKGSLRQLSLRDEATLKEILRDKYDYVHDELFDAPGAEKKLLLDTAPIKRPDVSWYRPVMDNPSEGTRSGNVGTVLLTAAEEQTLFRQFNYCRFRVAQLKGKVDAGPISSKDALDILSWHRRAEQLREQIVQTNLALVLAMAKRTRMTEVDFADLVSEGNMALLRAVNKFDVSRGFKFSTYACRAILKAFSRMGVSQSKYRQLFPTDFDPKLEKSDFMESKRAGHEDDCVDEVREIMDNNRADLSDIEQSVIEHRFALRHRVAGSDKPLTLEQVGRIIGVTKERVRQIQNKALDKIRQKLESDFLS